VHDNSLEMKSVVVLYIVALLQPVLHGKIIEEKLKKEKEAKGHVFTYENDSFTALDILADVGKIYKGVIIFNDDRIKNSSLEKNTHTVLNIIYGSLPGYANSTVVQTSKIVTTNKSKVDYFVEFDFNTTYTNEEVLVQFLKKCPKTTSAYSVECMISFYKTKTEISHCIEYYEDICAYYESDCFVVNGTSFCQKTPDLNENSCVYNTDCNYPYGTCLKEELICQCSFGFSGSKCTNPIELLLTIFCALFVLTATFTILYSFKKYTDNNVHQNSEPKSVVFYVNEHNFENSFKTKFVNEENKKLNNKNEIATIIKSEKNSFYKLQETVETQTDADFTEYIEPNVYNQESITVRESFRNNQSEKNEETEEDYICLN